MFKGWADAAAANDVAARAHAASIYRTRMRVLADSIAQRSLQRPQSSGDATTCADDGGQGGEGGGPASRSALDTAPEAEAEVQLEAAPVMDSWEDLLSDEEDEAEEAPPDAMTDGRLDSATNAGTALGHERLKETLSPAQLEAADGDDLRKVGRSHPFSSLSRRRAVAPSLARRPTSASRLNEPAASRALRCTAMASAAAHAALPLDGTTARVTANLACARHYSTQHSCAACNRHLRRDGLGQDNAGHRLIDAHSQ